MTPSRRSFLAGTMALVGRPGGLERKGPAPLSVGVVNVRTCFEKNAYTRMAEALDDVGKIREQFTQELLELQKKISLLSGKMENLPHSSDLYVDYVRLRAHAEYDLKLLQEVARRKVRDRANDLEARVYADLHRVVAALAAAQNLDLVLRVDEPRLLEEDPESGALPRIASRPVLFHAPALDVTAQVVARLNQDWARAWPCAGCKRKVADETCPDCGAKRP